MVIPITVKIINTTETTRDLFGREFSFDFDISLTVDVLKKYLHSLLELNTESFNINDNVNQKLYPNYTLENTMLSRKYLDIIDNNENIFYLYFTNNKFYIL